MTSAAQRSTPVIVGRVAARRLRRTGRPEATPGPGATGGAPYLVLHGAAAALARKHAARLHVSLTHTAQVAIAFVVAEQPSA